MTAKFEEERSFGSDIDALYVSESETFGLDAFAVEIGTLCEERSFETSVALDVVSKLSLSLRSEESGGSSEKEEYFFHYCCDLRRRIP